MEDVKDYFSEYFATLFDKARQKDDGTIKTLDEMSDEITISKAALSNYINGKREPKISSLMTIAQFFNVSPNDLLGYKVEQEQDTQAIAACLYTGLSLNAIEMLHRSKNNFLHIECLSYLLGSEEFLENVVNYLLTSLYDDVATDERYNLLPGSQGISEEKSKAFYYDIIGSLPMLREHFHQSAIKAKPMRKKYVSEMAMKCVDHETVFQELYPYVPYREDLSPEECATLDRDIRDAVSPKEMHLSCSSDIIEKMYPQEETSGLSQDQMLEELSTYDDIQYKFDYQCEAFWKEYYSRIAK